MHDHTKIQSLQALTSILSPLRPEKKIVHCHGVFDLLHIGHIRYLRQAKTQGDILVVTLTQDKYVNKGPHRPAFTEIIRAEVLASLDFVDYVSINQWPTAVDTIRLLKPHIYAKGAEFRANPTEELLKEKQAIDETGGKIVFIEEITSSSSTLLNQHFDLFSEEVRTYLNTISGRYGTDEILSVLNALSGLKTLIIGDAILDEYQYCEAIGKSSKEPTLVARYLSTDISPGGSLAVANHVGGFCDRTTVATFLGGVDSYEPLIRERLHPDVTPVFFSKQDCPTIIKRRYIENYFLSKLFEVYVIDDRALNSQETSDLCRYLRETLPLYDVVIVADFGHGLLTAPVIEVLREGSGYLAVNTQVNAGNRGFNTISKYPRADYICLAEHEVRLEMRDRHGDLQDMMMQITERLNCSCILVTRGKYGTVCYHREQGFCEAPALATRVIDRVGAGDAVFAITSLCAARQTPIDLMNFIGNVVGAEAVTIMGNVRSIERTPLQRHIVSLLK